MINHAKCYKKDYPRPRLVRGGNFSLNGKWKFAFDDKNEGERLRFFEKGDFGGTITVPFDYRTEASGVADPSDHSILWYSKTFSYSLPKSRRLLLHFEGADYFCKVWLNGYLLGTHTGGYSRFSFDVTDYLNDGENLLVVKCEDGFSSAMPRGKQRYVESNVSCFYTPTSGLWKTVWAEEVGEFYLERVTSSAEYANGCVLFEYRVNRYEKGLSLLVEAEYMGTRVAAQETELFADYGKMRLDLTLYNKVLPLKPWSIGRSNQFFDLKITLKKDNVAVDEVGSYTALVDYRARANVIEVNYLPCYYFRMVLDQGYYPGSGLTPKNDDELLRDVLLIKQAGFNGVRMHQKIEDERFYYFCDMVGLFCWLEMPAAYDFSPESTEALIKEWTDIVLQYKGYLSIMAYVPVNESWGVLQTSENERMQQLTAALYRLTKSLDPTRLVISNDGWEHTESDIVTLHNYAQSGREMSLAYENLEEFLNGKLTKDLHVRGAFCEGWRYSGQPVIISEYGGVAYRKNSDAWGYATALSEDDFFARLKELTEAVVSVKGCQGYCLTQFTDVMQEQNGLFTEDRQPKIDIEKIKELNLTEAK